MKILEDQLNLIKLAIQHINKLNKFGVNVAKSSFCYMNAQEITPGYSILKNFQNRRKFNLKHLFVVIRHIFSVSTLSNFKVLNTNKNFSNISYDKLIISWAKKENFLDDGSFYDSKFRINSKEDGKILWFLIYLDHSIPKKIDKNLLIFYKKKNIIKYNIYYFLKIITKSIIKNRKSLFKFLHEVSLQSQFAEIVTKNVKQIAIHNNFKSVIVPYESQPFQNNVFKEIKKINNKIKTIGYIATNQGFPSHNIYREGAPEILFVHSFSEISHLENYLGWPKENLRLIPSLKFKKSDKNSMFSKIFIPYTIISQGKLLLELDNFLTKQENNGLRNFEIKNHPYRNESYNHKKFINNLQNILKKNNKKFLKDSKNQLSIFFCETYAIFEALAKGVKVIQICNDPVFQAYNEKLWPSIKVIQISKYVFEYQLKEPKYCINLGVEEDTFDKYINSI